MSKGSPGVVKIICFAKDPLDLSDERDNKQIVRYDEIKASKSPASKDPLEDSYNPRTNQSSGHQARHFEERGTRGANIRLGRLRFFFCEECDFLLTSREDLELHKEEEHQEVEGAFICFLCESSFISGVGLLEHQRKKHSRKLNTKGRREEVSVHKCDHCNATFRFKESLKIHCQNVHPQDEKKSEEPTAEDNNIETWDEIVDFLAKDNNTEAKKEGSSNLTAKDNSTETKEGGSADLSVKDVKIEAMDQSADLLATGEDKIEDRAENMELSFNDSNFHDDKNDLGENSGIKDVQSSDTGKSPQQEHGSADLTCMCGQIFYDEQDMTDHINFIHSGIRAHECNKCGTQFGRLKMMKKHAETVCQHLEPEDDNEFKCKTCYRSFYTEQTLQDHVAYFHRNKENYKCSECQISLPFKLMLENHLCKHNKEPPLEETTEVELFCKICEKTFDSKQAKIDHSNYIHGKRKCHQCKLCGKEFGFKACLDQHLAVSLGCRANPHTGPYECDECEMQFLRKRLLSRHISRSHSKKKHFCHLCSAGYSKEWRLKLHIRLDHDNNPSQTYDCEECGKVCGGRDNLFSHMGFMHAKEGKRICVFCGQRFCLKVELSAHVKEHHKDEKSFITCDVCSKTFLDKSSLGKHYRQVHQISEVTCDQCGRLFKNMYQLKIHFKNHHQKPAPFTCTVCNIQVADVSRKVHMRSHRKPTTPKVDLGPAFCPFCLKKFKNDHGLKIHLNTIHGEQTPMTCDRCGLVFPKKAKLLKHMKEAHTKTGEQNPNLPETFFLSPVKKEDPNAAKVVVESVVEDGWETIWVPADFGEMLYTTETTEMVTISTSAPPAV